MLRLDLAEEEKGGGCTFVSIQSCCIDRKHWEAFAIFCLQVGIYHCGFKHTTKLHEYAAFVKHGRFFRLSTVLLFGV
jgi:hypothetical protein